MHLWIIKKKRNHCDFPFWHFALFAPLSHLSILKSCKEITKTGFLCLSDVQMDCLLAPAGGGTTLLWNDCECTRGSTIKRAAHNWEGASCLVRVSHCSPRYEKSLLRDLKGLGVSTKGKWIACVFPFASLNIGTQKAFRREIMLQALQSKWDSPHEKQILSNPWVRVGVCLRCKCKACWDSFLRRRGSERFNV